MYEITITSEAELHLRALSAREQRVVEAAVLTKLQQAPETPTKAIKRLRPNPSAAFELRVGNLRVLHNLEETQVVILVVGRKVGSKLIVAGEEFYAHQDDFSEPSGGRPPSDAE